MTGADVNNTDFTGLDANIIRAARLIVEASQGDRVALNALFEERFSRKELGRICSYWYWHQRVPIRGLYTDNDLRQDVCIRICANIGRFRLSAIEPSSIWASFKSWVRIIAVNTLLDQVRSQVRETRCIVRDIPPLKDTSMEGSQLYEAEMREVVTELSPKEQIALGGSNS